jgi:NADH-quinone oxidoreductase subunit K
MTAIPLEWALFAAAALLCIGLYAVLAQRNAVTVLMGILLMLNAAIVNLIAFWRYADSGTVTGQAFTLFVYFIAAAETVVGLALVIALWRSYSTIVLDEADSLKG